MNYWPFYAACVYACGVSLKSNQKADGYLHDINATVVVHRTYGGKTDDDVPRLAAQWLFCRVSFFFDSMLTG